MVTLEQIIEFFDTREFFSHRLRSLPNDFTEDLVHVLIRYGLYISAVIQIFFLFACFTIPEDTSYPEPQYTPETDYEWTDDSCDFEYDYTEEPVISLSDEQFDELTMSLAKKLEKKKKK